MASREPWYQDGVRFDCSKSGKCCTAHGQYDRVYLADDEAEAVAALLGLTLEQLERDHCRFEDGWRLVRFRDGGCGFLDGKRCSVYEARPVQCRTWPFWRENLHRATWKKDVAAFCPGVGQGRLYTREEIDAIAAESDDVQ